MSVVWGCALWACRGRAAKSQWIRNGLAVIGALSVLVFVAVIDFVGVKVGSQGEIPPTASVATPIQIAPTPSEQAATARADAILDTSICRIVGALYYDADVDLLAREPESEALQEILTEILRSLPGDLRDHFEAMTTRIVLSVYDGSMSDDSPDGLGDSMREYCIAHIDEYK